MRPPEETYEERKARVSAERVAQGLTPTITDPVRLAATVRDGRRLLEQQERGAA